MRFEYMVRRIPVRPDDPEAPQLMEQWLNEFGAKGWEVVGMGCEGCFIFKRKLD